MNVVLLWCAALEHRHQTHEWASFLQWKSKGESVRKGEKGSLVVYYDTIEREDEGGETHKIPFLKASVVFNRCQLAGFEPEEALEPEAASSTFERVAKADAFVAATGAAVEHRQGGAFYDPGQDMICMPPPEEFFDTETCTAGEHYYAALHHELVHWTGSPKRLDRLKSKKYADAHYATEELVAELGAAFLCAHLGLDTAEKGDHAAYIAHWLGVLRSDKGCLLTAASEAGKAVDYLEGLQNSA